MTPVSTNGNSGTLPSSCDSSSADFPIVGIGASAGGLIALENFFSAMPGDSGIAFVVVSHLSPDHISLLPSLIGRKSSMPVLQVEEGLEVLPNHVYIIPPGREMTISEGRLHVSVFHDHITTGNLIDGFMRALAEDISSKAISIILSGTGSDGTLGVRAIKAEGGMVMVQDPESADYEGMPKSAIATGLADYVMPPDKMPPQLLNYVKHQGRETNILPIPAQENYENSLKEIFQILRTETTNDFSLYKTNTINRRIERRMHVHHLDSLHEYVQLLQNSKHEISVLFRELLIGVTNFFREPEVFELLKKTYLPELLKNKTDDNQIRIWVPGCSTGEEAYSLAIVLTECMEMLGRHPEVQIFATDLDEIAINTARKGVYPESISADISHERLARFFTKVDHQYMVKKTIREMVTFAQQNIIRDPPFTKLDILSCRNLLIYFGSKLQKKLIPLFHYSLKQPGLLLIGSSETIGNFNDLFDPVDKKYKLFRRVVSETSSQSLLQFPHSRPFVKMPAPKIEKQRKVLSDMSNAKLLKTILAQSEIPSCVIIDDTADILYIHGRTGRYLEPAEGKASLNLLKMARPSIETEIAKAFHKTKDEGVETRIDKISLNENGDYGDINIIVRPLSDFEFGRGMMLIIFEAVPDQKADKPGTKIQRKRKKQVDEIKKLEEKLNYTRENLQSTIEELESSNEELKSTNEELQSTNEELQSTNEELETSKEELQSLHEESSTVNAELQSRIDELVAANDDIKNLLEATEIATIFLDIDFNIRRFTTRVTDIFPLSPIDTGRPISHFASQLKDVDIQQYAERVLTNLEKMSVEVSDKKGCFYRMQLRPYRTTTNVIDGVVITFEDITELKHLLDKAKRLATVVQDSNDAITLQDLQGNILAWNKGAELLYGFSEAEALKMNMHDLVPSHCHDDLNLLYNSLLTKDIESYQTERVDKAGKIIQVWLTITRLFDEMGKPEFIATTERDLDKLKTPK
ncbi:CheR family methyltransferase [Desulfosediminicola flagellatus]|uniref:CheR family methyltransferase n=1 Tax=Desulfosediminicola flagellatus TaxID=2569541 RepID=UPI0010ABA5BB|nr:chemotaxis protein CheB [Desulfosediminicola flagellatus]